MAGTRFSKLEASRREKLLEVAAEEFAERGYGAAPFNRIVAGAGLSKGLLHYAEDEADLLATAVESATTRLAKMAAGFSLGELSAETY